MPAHRDDVVDLAETFSHVARALAKHGDVQPTLDEIVSLAVDTLEACEFAGISLVEGKKITSPASSKEAPRVVAHIQSELGEGPCIDAIKEDKVVETGKLEEEDRWPNFAPRAYEETGIQSVLSIRLYIDGDTMGALNLYSSEQDAFDESDAALGSVFAAHAAIAMWCTRREQDLECKAETRDVIGQAKGMLMARQRVSAEEAFDILNRASQRLNEKVRVVAEQLVNDELPKEPPAQ